MKGHGFSVFDNAAYVGGICAEGAATYTRRAGGSEYPGCQ